MKDILNILLITCVCLSTISCATKSNDSAKGILFYRESFGEWGWHEDGDEEKDGIYEGEIRKGKPDGQGTYTHYSETKSRVLLLSVMIPGWGESIVFALIIWEMLHQGKPKIQDAKYVGAWKRGEKHGDGTYYFPNGDRYEGTWRDGRKHGQRTYTFSDGDLFVGEWKDGKVHGNGTYTYPDGAKLIGKWKNGKKNREGKLILSD